MDMPSAMPICSYGVGDAEYLESVAGVRTLEGVAGVPRGVFDSPDRP